MGKEINTDSAVPAAKKGHGYISWYQHYLSPLSETSMVMTHICPHLFHLNHPGKILSNIVLQ